MEVDSIAHDDNIPNISDTALTEIDININRNCSSIAQTSQAGGLFSNWALSAEDVEDDAEFSEPNTGPSVFTPTGELEAPPLYASLPNKNRSQRPMDLLLLRYKCLPRLIAAGGTSLSDRFGGNRCNPPTFDWDNIRDDDETDSSSPTDNMPGDRRSDVALPWTEDDWENETSAGTSPKYKPLFRPQLFLKPEPNERVTPSWPGVGQVSGVINLDEFDAADIYAMNDSDSDSNDLDIDFAGVKSEPYKDKRRIQEIKTVIPVTEPPVPIEITPNTVKEDITQFRDRQTVPVATVKRETFKKDKPKPKKNSSVPGMKELEIRVVDVFKCLKRKRCRICIIEMFTSNSVKPSKELYEMLRELRGTKKSKKLKSDVVSKATVDLKKSSGIDKAKPTAVSSSNIKSEKTEPVSLKQKCPSKNIEAAVKVASKSARDTDSKMNVHEDSKVDKQSSTNVSTKDTSFQTFLNSYSGLKESNQSRQLVSDAIKKSVSVISRTTEAAVSHSNPVKNEPSVNLRDIAGPSAHAISRNTSTSILSNISESSMDTNPSKTLRNKSDAPSSKDSHLGGVKEGGKNKLRTELSRKSPSSEAAAVSQHNRLPVRTSVSKHKNLHTFYGHPLVVAPRTVTLDPIELIIQGVDTTHYYDPAKDPRLDPYLVRRDEVMNARPGQVDLITLKYAYDEFSLHDETDASDEPMETGADGDVLYSERMLDDMLETPIDKSKKTGAKTVKQRRSTKDQKKQPPTEEPANTAFGDKFIRNMLEDAVDNPAEYKKKLHQQKTSIKVLKTMKDRLYEKTESNRKPSALRIGTTSSSSKHNSDSDEKERFDPRKPERFSPKPSPLAETPRRPAEQQPASVRVSVRGDVDYRSPSTAADNDTDTSDDQLTPRFDRFANERMVDKETRTPGGWHSGSPTRDRNPAFQRLSTPERRREERFSAFLGQKDSDYRKQNAQPYKYP